MIRKIKFKGEEFILVGSSSELEGAIATREQYENFEDSYAHLFSDGTVKRYKVVIGNLNDIEFLD